MSDHRALIEALRRPPTSRTTAIAALADVSLLRTTLDDFERAAIDTARAHGASWAEIAAALGLASRQAAEQRRARLKGDKPERQQDIDKLEKALRNLATLLDTTTARHPTGPRELARQTITLALEAPPGQQIDLARLIITDLRDEAPTIAAAVRRISALVH